MDILLVDDHEGNRYAKRRMLQRAGYSVIEAASGEEALRLVATRHPPIVLLDIKLPDISGFDVCQKIKCDPATASTMVVQLSAAFVEGRDKVRGLEQGADVYLVEPIQPDELVATVRAMQRLVEAEHSLRQAHDTLESRVQERTADLAQANAALQQEIAKHKRTTEALRQSHQFLQSTLDALATPVAILDASGTIHAVNTAWQRTAATRGFAAPAYSRGMTYAAFLATVDGNTPGVQAVLAGLDDVLTQQRYAFYIEHSSHASADAELRCLLIRMTRFAAPQELQVVVVHEDITDIKQAEAAIRHQQEILFQHEKLASMGSLLASVAHELNNPLAVVRMQVDLLNEEAANTPLYERTKELHQATEHCMRIVHNFLTLARQNPPQRSAVQLNTLVEDALELLAHALRLDNITVHTRLTHALPLFEADPVQMHQVVINLLVNAQQALRDSAPPRQITITTGFDQVQNRLVFELADTGPGIPAVIQRRIFEPFFTTKPLGVGTGIGLSLCRNIIESHGGTIDVTSQMGQGAVFRIELPVGAPAPVVAAPSPAPALPPSPSARTIFVVDDEPGIRRALAHLLRREEHTVDTAMDGRQALQMLQEQQYDLVLCDLRMPELDGPGLYRAITTSQPHYLRRFVFLTGDTLSSETETFLNQSGAPRLVKPFSAAQVRQAVRQALQAQG
jgi:signal transduction histidine kinase/DNA-binding response OmpR family regulator